jgi:epoxyqueuosine reductase
VAQLTSQQNLGANLIERARSLGFACAGIASLEPIEHADALRDWIEAGLQGEMGYLAENNDKRVHPEKILDGARCAIVVGDLYASRDANIDETLEPGHGRIARYARGRDYHKLIKKRLVKLLLELQQEYPEAEFKAFVDTAPIPERDLALRAGIGWVGKHTLIIHPQLGSYIFLGGIIMTLDASNPPEIERVSDHCGTCTRCIDACPTQAITPHRVDATRCISYLTIEHRSEIDPRLKSKMGEWVYGCDVCQEVCPHNSPKPSAWLDERSNPAYQSDRSSFDLLEVLEWDDDARREAFEGSAMKRAKLGMMQRNAAINLSNSWDALSPDQQLAGRQALVSLLERSGARSLAGTAAREALLAIDNADGGDDQHEPHPGHEPD